MTKKKGTYIFKTKKLRKTGLKVCIFCAATLINVVLCTGKNVEAHNISLTIVDNI